MVAFGVLSIWRVTMVPSQRGPEHAFDTEQVWTVIDGQMGRSAMDPRIL